MAKSIRSKKEKRLRAIRREIVTPYYENKDAVKLAAQAAAVAAPKLPVKPTNPSSTRLKKKKDLKAIRREIVPSPMELAPAASDTAEAIPSMDMETDDGSQKKDLVGVAKMSKQQFKVGKRKRYGKGKGKGRVKRRHI